MQDRLGHHQGKFKPQNPEKYKGDPMNIIFRSSWERIFCNWCDKNSKISLGNQKRRHCGTMIQWQRRKEDTSQTSLSSMKDLMVS